MCVGAGVGCRIHFAPLDATETPTASDRYSAAVLADGPGAYWRLGESSGAVARDELGGHPGTFVGDCELGVAGAVEGGNTAVRFDGSSCHIDVGDAFSFGGGVPFTIELWVAPAAASSTTRFLVSRNTPVVDVSNGYQLCFQAAFTWFERLYDGSGSGYLEVSPLALDTFQLIAVTYDGTAQRFFVNGIDIGSNSVGAGPVTSGTLVFGDSARGVFFKFAGVLDEIAFYPHAIAPNRVAAHYAAR